MTRKKGRVKPGAWFTRDILLSPAYVKLSSSGKTILSMFYLKRDMSKNHECLNNKNLSVTYKELEALGLSRGSVTAGIDDLLAKGFIEIVRVGGAYQQDKTICGLTDKWRWWRKKDPPIRERTPGRKSGYFALQ